MTDSRTGTALLALLFCTLTGCAAATLQSSPLPDGYAIKNLTKVDAGTPFALNRSGSIAAVVEGITQIMSSAGGPARDVAPAPATILDFSPGGDRLAAAFCTPNKSILNLFDLQGKALGEAIILGRVTSIAWRSEHELLATALEIKKFTFGSELVSKLYRWDTLLPPVATTLSDVTVRPIVAKLPEATLLKSLSMALSPYGDEIAYSALKDPPLFTPYLIVAVRHLETGKERAVAEIGIGSGGPVYAPDGESLLAGDARALTRRFSLPDGKEIDAWPAPGDQITVSPGGSYFLLDGRLYHEGREVISFPREATSAFLPDGSGFAVSSGEMLYLVTGLKEPQRPSLSGNLERLLELRRLRMLGLITDQEFKARRKKVSAP